jgi:hypothetical protein
MSNYNMLIANAVQQALGQAMTGSIGNHYSVYRATAAVSGSVFESEPIFTGYAAYLTKATKSIVEGAALELEVFNADCDNRTLQFGDVLVGTDPLDLGTYVFAQYRPLIEQSTLFVECNTLAQIFRPRVGNPVPAGTAPAATPGAPFIASSFVSSDEDTQEPLTLVDGVYAFGVPGATAAIVPVGLQLTARAGGTRGSANNLPGSSATARFVGYVPPLAISINQNDVIYVDDDHSYIVNLALNQTKGFVGTVVILEEQGD